MSTLHLTDNRPVGDASTDSPVSVEHPAGGTHSNPSPTGVDLNVSPWLNGTFLVVHPWDVEHGDRLFGLRTLVASITSDGIWWEYGDDGGVVIAQRHSGARVQVIRDSPEGGPCGDSGGSRGAASSDNDVITALINKFIYRQDALRIAGCDVVELMLR